MVRVTHYQRCPTKGAYSMERLYEDIRAHLPNDIHTTVRLSRFQSKGLLRRLYDTILARFYQGDVNHIVGDVHFITYLLDSRRTVMTIHDCFVLNQLKGVRGRILWFFWYWLPEKRCKKIIVVSESTRKEVLKYLGCEPSKVIVIHNNVSEEFVFSPRPFNSENPRILQIGTKKNKNIKRLAEALSDISCHLSIVGSLTPSQIEILEMYEIDYSSVVNLSRAELLQQYQQCDLVVFASLQEGFGLPIVEANSTGRPVVTSNVWSMPEVAADAACLVDPFDVSSIREGILKVIEDADYRESLIEKGIDNARRFHIENIAFQYADVYREVSKKIAFRNFSIRENVEKKNL